MANTYTRKQFETLLARITETAVRPVARGARATVTVQPGRPHKVAIRVKAVIKQRPLILETLRTGITWTQELVREWPTGVFVGIEPPGAARLLDSGQVALDLQMAGLEITD